MASVVTSNKPYTHNNEIQSFQGVQQGPHTCMTESWCAKSDLWQSPKSRPQILIFLSALPETSRVLSEEMSMDNTGSLCPYSDRKNFKLSRKNTCASQVLRNTAE